MNPVAAAAASQAASDPKLVRGAGLGVGILVVVLLGAGLFFTFKVLQKVGVIGDAQDRLVNKWQGFIGSWKGLDPAYAGGGRGTLSQSQVITYANTLKEAISTGWIGVDDEDAVYGALENIGSAVNLSAVAKRYSQLTNKSLRSVIIDNMSGDDEVVQLARIFANYTDFDKSVRDSNIQL